MFVFDFLLFIRCNLPPFLRKPVMVAWLNVLFAPLVSLWTALLTHYNQIVTDADITSQTDILQAALRVLYPTTAGGYRCYIHTVYDDKYQGYDDFVNEHHAVEYDYFESENLPQGDTSHEFFVSEYDRHGFYVYVPIDYTLNQLAIISFINRYRAAGHPFILDFINLI